MKKIILIFIVITFFGTAIFAQNDSGCPTLSVTGPPGFTELGEDVTFSASLTGDYDKQKIVYNWSVDQGEIIEGQGTPVIKVSKKGLGDTTITANVEIIGLPEKCESISASETELIICLPSIELFAVFDVVTEKQISTKIENLYQKLQLNPSMTAYVLTYGITSDIEKRENFVRSFIKTQKFDGNRIVFISNDNEKELRTEIYLVPPGAKPPIP